MKKVEQNPLNIIKRLIHISLGLFLLAFIALSVTFSAYRVNLGDKSTVKSWVVRAGIFDKITPNSYTLLTDGTGESLQHKLDSSKLNQEEIKQAIESVYNAPFYAAGFDKLVDDIYLRTSASDLQDIVEVSAKSRAEQLEEKLGSTLIGQLSNLPTCSSEQSANYPKEFDPFEIECSLKDPSFDLSKNVDSYVSQLTDDDSFLGSISVSSQELVERYDLKDNYRNLKIAALLMPIVSLAAIVGIVITSKNRFKSLKNTGYLIVIYSVVIGLFYMVLQQLTKFNLDDDSLAGSAMVENVVNPIVHNMVGSLASSAIFYSVISAVFGGLMVYAHLLIEEFTDIGGKKTKESKIINNYVANSMTLDKLSKLTGSSKQETKSKKSAKSKASASAKSKANRSSQTKKKAPRKSKKRK